MENTGSASVLIRIATSAGEHRKKSVPLFGKGRARKEKGVRSSGFNIGNGENKHGQGKEEIWKYCRGKGIRRAGIRRLGDGNIRSYTIPLSSLSLSFSLQTVDRVPLRQNVKEERSSLENVQRRGKLNLFERLSGMDSSGSRLMRFSDYSREE